MQKPVLATFALVAAFAAHASADAAPLPKPPAFAICGTCHVATKGARSTLGPNLWGVGGRRVGTLPGFNYSPALKNAGFLWSRDNLIIYITNPRAKIPGTRMTYAGQKNPRSAAAIADYLMSLK